MKLQTWQLLTGVVLSTIALQAQPTVMTLTAVPRIVRVNSSYHPANGAAPAAVESATLAIYAAETGGTALWQETQNVSVDSDGHYSVLLGSTRTEGLPQELFASVEPRWLGVQFQRAGESEQPRVLLASVPYALKAVDAETLGGRPASDYLLSSSAATTGSAASITNSAPATVTTSNLRAPKPAPRLISAGGIPVFTDPGGDLGNSVMSQSGTKVGLGTAAPFDFFHVAFTDTTGGFTGYAVQNLGSTSSSFSGMLFYDQNNALGQFQGFNNSTHEYRINNIAKNVSNQFNGSINFMIGSASKFLVRSDGDIDIPQSIRKNGTLFINTLGGTTSTGVGLGALANGASGSRNTAFGNAAMSSTLTSAAQGNSAFGFDALNGLTTGNSNSAFGDGALLSNTSGTGNSAFGYFAAFNNTIATNNTAVGAFSMHDGNPLTGSNNTAVGETSLDNNTAGNNNVALGQAAMFKNTTGANNVAVGQNALTKNGDGNENTAVGENALGALTSGSDNTAIGKEALNNLTLGNNNIAIGVQAGGQMNTGSNNIFIGSAGADNQTGTMILGGGNQTSTFIFGINGTTVSGGQEVFINGTNQLGTVNSSRRFKQDIQDMGDHSRDLMKLRPVVFHYKVAPNEPLEYGLIAEEVEQVYPDLVVRNKDGDIQTVQYHKLPSLLLNEVQRQQRTITEQQDQIRQQNGLIQQQRTELQQQKDDLRALVDRLTAIEGRLSSLGLQ